MRIKSLIGGLALMFLASPVFADLAPNKERYEAFIEAWGQANADASTDYAQKNYPGMRELTGEYMMREITLK